MTIADAQRFSRRAGLPFRRIDEQILVVNPAGREVHMLNGTASHIWELLDHPLTIEDLMRRIHGEEGFDAGSDVVARDIAAFVFDLVSKRLLEIEGARADHEVAASVTKDLSR